MLLDALAQYSDQQVITATAVSTNVLDHGAPGTPVYSSIALSGDKGPGVPMDLLIQVTADFNTLTSLTAAFQTSVDEAFTAPIVLCSQVIALAKLKAGQRFSPKFLPDDLERFTRVTYTVIGTDPTVGKVSAALTAGNQSNS